MAKDQRHLLEVLEAELRFVEQGGYGRSIRTPWFPTSIFQDSSTCLNLGDPDRSRPCSECLLMDLVPCERRSEEVPCHHIPLTPQGETIYYLERCETQDVMEEKVKQWLVRMIKQVGEARAERAKSAAAAGAGSWNR
jgi:hypothetical protein